MVAILYATGHRSAGVAPLDWTLVLLAASRKRRLQPLRIQRALHLLGTTLRPEQLDCPDFYTFTKSEYGTFSLAAHVDMERLVECCFVSMCHSRWPAREYVTTAVGVERAERILRTLSPDVAAAVAAVVASIESTSIRDLVATDRGPCPNGNAEDGSRSGSFMRKS